MMVVVVVAVVVGRVGGGRTGWGLYCSLQRLTGVDYICTLLIS